jgi:hypothetical protein
MCGRLHEYLGPGFNGCILKIRRGLGMRVRDCAECTRRWDTFAVATMRHLKAKGSLDIATYSHDSEAIALLAVPVNHAATRRLEAEQALRHHQQQAHPESAAADDPAEASQSGLVV